MTQREFFTAIVNSNVDDELKAFATESIEKLDIRNAKRSERETKTQKENKPIIEKIASVLTSEPMLASDIATACEISVQKASALAKKVEGVSVCDLKVKGKGTQKGYYFEAQSSSSKRTRNRPFLLGWFFRTCNVRKTI